MSKYHDHRSDCPFKFASLDVCDCVEHNMLDRIEALTKERDEAMQLLQTLSNMNGDLSRDMYKTKLLLAQLGSIEKRVTSFEDATEQLAECGCARCKAHLKLRALLAEIEESDAP